LSLQRSFTTVVSQAVRYGREFAVLDDGIGRAGDDRLMAEGGEAFVNVADDRFDGSVTDARSDRLVDRRDMENVQWLRLPHVLAGMQGKLRSREFECAGGSDGHPREASGASEIVCARTGHGLD